MTEIILQWGAIAGALMGIFSFLIWVYKKLISEPNQELEKRLQKENNEALRTSIAPLTDSIKQLNYLLEESKKDRECLHNRDSQQEIVLDDHETRITVLEDWRERRRD